MMRLDLATADYIGARSQQQDAAAAQLIGGRGGALLILADGLGGHESGAEASQIVIETFKKAAAVRAFDDPDGRRDALRDAIEEANKRIGSGVDPAHGHRGMASTAVAAVVAEGQVQWVSVGDSHLYVWRDGQLHKLNEDHSQAGLLIKTGRYKPDDPEVRAAKSVLVSALTGRPLEMVDLPEEPFFLEKGDVLLLASDGLNTLTDDEIGEIVADVETEGAIRLSTRLLETVRDRRLDRQDNTTVAVARIVAVDAEGAPDPITEIGASANRPDTVPALVREPQPSTEPPAPKPATSAKSPAPVVAKADDGKALDGATGEVPQPITLPGLPKDKPEVPAAASRPRAVPVEARRPLPPEITGIEPRATAPPTAKQATRRGFGAVLGLLFMILLAGGAAALGAIYVYRPDWLGLAPPVPTPSSEQPQQQQQRQPAAAPPPAAPSVATPPRPTPAVTPVPPAPSGPAQSGPTLTPGAQPAPPERVVAPPVNPTPPTPSAVPPTATPAAPPPQILPPLPPQGTPAVPGTPATPRTADDPTRQPQPASPTPPTETPGAASTPTPPGADPVPPQEPARRQRDQQQRRQNQPPPTR